MDAGPLLPTDPVTSLPPVNIKWHDTTQGSLPSFIGFNASLVCNFLDFYYANILENYRVLAKLGQGQFGLPTLTIFL